MLGGVVLACLLASRPAGASEEAVSAKPWWAGELALRVGADWSSGDYGGAEETDLWFVPVSLGYTFDGFAPTPYAWDQFELRVSSSYLRIRGPGDFFTDGAAGVSANRRSDEGVGDTWLRGIYVFLPKPTMPLPVFELEGKLKIPTASNTRDLGTGKLDGALEATVSRSFGPVTPLLSVGWRFRKDPAATNLRSHATASAGASFRLHERLSAGLLYDWRDRSAEGRSRSHELVPHLSFKPTPRVAISPYAVWGIAGYVPDYAFGVTFRYQIRID